MPSDPLQKPINTLDVETWSARATLHIDSRVFDQSRWLESVIIPLQHFYLDLAKNTVGCEKSCRLRWMGGYIYFLRTSNLCSQTDHHSAGFNISIILTILALSPKTLNTQNEAHPPLHPFLIPFYFSHPPNPLTLSYYSSLIITNSPLHSIPLPYPSSIPSSLFILPLHYPL